MAMSGLLLITLLLCLAGLGWLLGRSRALRQSATGGGTLHSLPSYYGAFVALVTLLPSLLLLLVWLIAQPLVLSQGAKANFPVSLQEDSAAWQLTQTDLRRLAGGLARLEAAGEVAKGQDLTPTATLASGAKLKEGLSEHGVALAAEITPELLSAAKAYRASEDRAALYRAIAVLAVALLGLAWGLRRVEPSFWARNRVESIVLGGLKLASLVAILTTIGIIWSMLSESLNFFSLYPIGDFFFGLTWNPKFQGGSELGFLPLLWGTLYITVIALLVAVPLGLFAAIYLAEYASKTTRSWVKPLIEVIAGIPTVAYGIFALVTVGPFLRDFFAQPFGFGTSGSSVLNAGIVIGILNIPFISSLSDDIINAVPQSLRDGSYGIGATRSETIRKVVLPAALPGIMGAVLMGASRAIGETMIVVMGAGAAAKLSLNPFEAMTTMTVKIVGQLTGDGTFHTPETLVAFALGITLFAITLGLNILAVWIVRKYREQYE